MRTSHPAHPHPATAHAIDPDHLLALVGASAFAEYHRADYGYRHPLYAWAQGLPDLDPDQFMAVARPAIYESSAVLALPSTDFEHLHFKASALAHEARRRHEQAHPTPDCPAPTLFDLAYNDTVREAGHGHRVKPLAKCTC